jgi:hypothetical protein
MMMSFFLDFLGVSSTAASFFSSFAIVFASLVAPSHEVSDRREDR